jgi:glycosyltransferase involved in cell wall biosynthesis
MLVLAVGRLEREKNPLLLADALALLRRQEPRWRLAVVGEGPMQGQLERRLEELGVREYAHLHGYVPMDDGLPGHYRQCHFLLHASWTEGMPQVLLEAFAARLPVVATAVGGVAEAAAGRALLVPPGDPARAASALRLLASDPSLRERLTQAAAEHVRRHTVEVESRRVAEFVRAGAAPSGRNGSRAAGRARAAW